MKMEKEHFSTRSGHAVKLCLLLPTGTKRLLQNYNGRVNSVSTQIPSCFPFFLHVIPQTAMTDWQVV